MPDVRRATPADLAGIRALEAIAFDPARRASRASLARSLDSTSQEVWVIDQDGIVGSLVLWLHPKTVRVYGIAVRPDLQGHGLGRALMRTAEREARRRGAGQVVLEADALDTRLVEWYEDQGYRRVAQRPDFYAPGRPAVRMAKFMPG